MSWREFEATKVPIVDKTVLVGFQESPKVTWQGRFNYPEAIL